MDSETVRTAVVTGASSGIGLGVARAFLEQGFNVVASSRRIEAGGVAGPGRAGPGHLRVVQGDIGQRDTALRIAATALEHFGRIDVLVNNAGIFISRPFTEYTTDEFQALVTTNLHGFFHLTQLAVAQMLKQGEGSIVNVTASIAEQPMASIPSVVPVLTKGGLNAATRALALELAPRGIRVNAVSPGAIETPLTAGAPANVLADMQPLGRPGQVGDIVDAVLFLTRAAYVTGEVLHVDGGMTAGRW